MQNKLMYVVFISGLLFNSLHSLYIATAANSTFFPQLLNFIGSLHKTNFDQLNTLTVFDLGLTEEQKIELRNIAKLELAEIRRVNPDILTVFATNTGKKLGYYSWKPVAIKQFVEKYSYVLWIDAGSTILRSLEPLAEHVQKNGYFLCTIGYGLLKGTERYKFDIEWQTIKHIREKFKLNEQERKHILRNEAVMGGICGVARDAQHVFLNEWYELAKDIKNFADDGTAPGEGRHDQALLGIIAYVNGATVFKQDARQKKPIELNIPEALSKGSKKQEKRNHFYITWVGDFVNEKTHIWSSRRLIPHLEFYKSCIRHRNSSLE